MSRRLRAAVRRAAVSSAAAANGLPPDGGAVALTFDDGPDPRFTPLVLAQLAESAAVATFFLVGHRVRRDAGIVREIVAAGHAIGSHTWSHPAPGELGLRDLTTDFRRGREAVEEVTGREVRLFRPPQGHVDTRVALAMRRCGLRPWLWTNDPRDWVPGRGVGEVVEAVGALSPGDVVLLHDGLERPSDPAALDRSATVAALPAIVRSARASGLRLAVLPER